MEFRVTKNKDWKYKSSRKLQCFGETDYNKKTITINKKKHRNKYKNDKRVWGSEAKEDRSLLNTIVHEELHRKHPKMTEKSVRKSARKVVRHLSPAQRVRLYKLHG